MSPGMLRRDISCPFIIIIIIIIIINHHLEVHKRAKTLSNAEGYKNWRANIAWPKCRPKTPGLRLSE